MMIINNSCKGSGGGGGGETDTRFKDLVEKTITEVNDDTITSISEYAFYKGNSLTTVNFPLVTSIGSNAFYFCSKLTTANFPLVTNVGGYAFDGCTRLKTVDLPLVTSIGTTAFYGCRSLETVDLPLVTSIGTTAFSGCNSLIALLLRNETICTASNAGILSNTKIAFNTGYIYVPSALIEDYKVATNWSTYAAQFRALEDYTVDGTTTGELDPTKI